LFAPVGGLCLVILVNALLPAVLSTRYRLGYDEAGPAPLAQLDPLTIDEVLDAADRTGGRKVFWIGDSVVWSGENGVTAPMLLESELRQTYGPDVHVFNASLPAARTADKYAILLRVLERKPALVIYESKYLEFSRAQVETVTFRYPYLNTVVAADPEYAGSYQSFPFTRPALVAPRSSFDVDIDRIVNRLASVLRYRALLQQVAFGGDLYSRLSGDDASEPPSTSNGGQRVTGVPPSVVARRPESFSGAYRSGPFEAFANAGLFFGHRVATMLDRTRVPVIAYVAALNHDLLGTLGDDALFRSNMAIVDGVFAGHRFAFSNYHGAIRDDRLFLDTEHLTVAGNLAMIRHLVGDHRAVFDRALMGY
jgi:hypothetical protein